MGQLSQGSIVQGVVVLWGQMPRRQLCYGGNCPMSSSPLGAILRGQFSRRELAYNCVCECCKWKDKQSVLSIFWYETLKSANCNICRIHELLSNEKFVHVGESEKYFFYRCIYTFNILTAKFSSFRNLRMPSINYGLQPLDTII